MMLERKTVSQSVSADYRKGWNDAVIEISNCRTIRFEGHKHGLMFEKMTWFDCVGESIVSPSDYCKGWNDVVAAMPKWISVEERLPNTEGDVMVIASMQPTENVRMEQAYLLGSYINHNGWIIYGREEWGKPKVHYWMRLPDLLGEV